MKSPRHTEVPKNGITRSYGVDKETGEDLVVELRPGEIEIRKEPTNVKRLNKNNLVRVVLDAQQIAENMRAPEEVTESEGEVVEILEALAKKIRIADLQECRNPGYELKVQLLQELKKVIQDLKE